MGAPFVYAGDLSSLTDANIARYRDRFDILERLQSAYDIYRHFQFSGVPAPTDTDWHWWGKLNPQHEGAVVVMRGSDGADKRAINIPPGETRCNLPDQGLVRRQSPGKLHRKRVNQREARPVAPGLRSGDSGGHREVRFDKTLN